MMEWSKFENFFMEKLDLLFLHPEKLEAMKQSALAFAKPLAGVAVAREILEFFMIDENEKRNKR